VNHYQTLNGYWMEQSGGKVGITSVTPVGTYRMPKNYHQYGLNDGFGQEQQGCPGTTTVTGAQSAVSTIAVKSTKFFHVGDVITIAGVSPSGRRTVTAIPDGTHLQLDAAVTVADKAGVNDCMGTRLETDADALDDNQAEADAAAHSGDLAFAPAADNQEPADAPASDTDEPADDIASASPTADEAEPADVDDDAATQDTEEYRA